MLDASPRPSLAEGVVAVVRGGPGSSVAWKSHAALARGRYDVDRLEPIDKWTMFPPVPAGSDMPRAQVGRDGNAAPENGLRNVLRKRTTAAAAGGAQALEEHAADHDDERDDVPGGAVVENLCCVHMLHSVPKNQGAFAKWGKGPHGTGGDGEEIMADLKAIINLTLPGSLAQAKELFGDKWKGREGVDPTYMEHFLTYWLAKRVTRIEVNLNNLLGGGRSPNSNGLESINLVQKIDLAWTRRSLILFHDELRRQLGTTSQQDVTFDGRAKDTAGGNVFWNRALFRRTKDLIEHKRFVVAKSKNFRAVQLWDSDIGANAEAAGYGMLLPRLGLIAYLERENGVPAGTATVGELKKMLEDKALDKTVTPPQKRDSYIDQFVALWSGEVGAKYKTDPWSCYTLADLFSWSNTGFCVLQNLFDTGGVAAFDEQVQWLRKSDVPDIKEDLMKKHLCKCSCETYMHRAWCHHVAAVAIHSGAMGYPARLEPTGLAEHKTKEALAAGAKPARKGGAWDFPEPAEEEAAAASGRRESSGGTKRKRTSKNSTAAAASAASAATAQQDDEDEEREGMWRWKAFW